MKKINANLFKESMSRFATGVTVITIAKNKKYYGKTVNSFASLSLNPPLVLFSLDKNSSSINIYKKTSFLGINILSKSQKSVSKFFSLKQSKWEDLNFFLSKNNIPMINDCLANLDCKIIKILKEGDHFIFICKINEVNIDHKKQPLIYFNSTYI